MVASPAAAAGCPVVIGAGIAGLMTALHLAPEPVIVLAKAPLGSGCASVWAQGGIAVAVGEDDDPARHAADTIAAGDGLCDAVAVERITASGPAALAELVRHGTAFDRAPDGRYRLGLEAGHGRRRIVHAAGDGTGRAITMALVEAVRRTPSIAVLEGVEARRLIVEDGAVVGVLAAADDRPVVLPTARVVIATGGIGGLYRETTNPLTAIGQGLALAARAGAVLANMEFVQFHPTALATGQDPMPLISEAVRGEGALLVDAAGRRIMADHPRAELEPRDIVARAVWHETAAGRRVFLDARRALGSRFAKRFPGVAAACRAAGIDPAVDPIPVRAAAHYHMGGIAVDAAGRSSIAGLWAVGEAAATGLHGANRLASNSLLEACVAGRTVAESVGGTTRRPTRPAYVPPLLPSSRTDGVRGIMAQRVGVLRNHDGLDAALEALAPLAFGVGAAADPALVGLFVAAAALQRRESRGSHARTDFRARSSAGARRSLLRLADVKRLLDIEDKRVAVGA
ncbi:MAG TPA: L-aspartate oxidase [Stellaceae bacterium]|nr:L-aspartate oxidase [Stellaceae bacterium]